MERVLRSKIVLFDLDGTLIDSTEAILESFYKAFESMQTTVPSDEQITALVGLPLEIMFERLGVDSDQTADYVKAYKTHYRTVHTQKTTLLPNAKEAVELAYTYAHLGVVTTKTRAYSEQLLEHFGLMDYFDVLVGREDVEAPKPDPEPIYKALNSMQHKFGQVVYMVGDTTMDMIAAEEADIASIGVLSGYMSEEQLEDEADFIREDALDAVKLIENL